MDFIFDRALLNANSYRLQRPRRALRGREEADVKNANVVQSDEFRTLDMEHTAGQDADRQFTPGDFFREAGIVIAVCLALGAILQVLLT